MNQPDPGTLTAADVKRLLALEPHKEGGCFVRTFASDELLEPSAFATPRYTGPRHTSTAIYYLLEPHTFSEMHVLASDEMFHHYLGDPVEMLQLHGDGSASRHLIGSDLLGGQRPQVMVRKSTWQGARLLSPDQGSSQAISHGFALLGCTVAPGFEYTDYISGKRSALLARWPHEARLITALTHPEPEPAL